MTDRTKPPEGYYPKRQDTLDGIRWQTLSTVGPAGQYGHETETGAIAACHEHADRQRAIGYEQGKADGARWTLRLLRAHGAITYGQEQEWGNLLIAATTTKETTPDCHGYVFRGGHDYRGTQPENRHCYHCGHLESKP